MISEILRRAKNEVKKTFMYVEDYHKLREGEHDVLSGYDYSISELNDLISELEATQWISVDYKNMIINENDWVLAKLQHWQTDNIIYQVLVYVNEDDCTWKVLDGGEYLSELSYDWDVIAYQYIIPHKNDKE